MTTEYTPLFYAASSGDLEAVVGLLPDASESERNQALAQAAALNHFETADRILESGGDANGVFDPLYGTVLFPSCEYLNPEGIAYLLSHEANPARVVTRVDGPRNALDHLLATHHRSPLKSRCIQLLLNAGAPDPKDTLMAIHLGSLERLVEALEREPEALHATLDIPYGQHPLLGGTLLHMAVEFHQPVLAEELIRRGLDVNTLADRIPGSANTEPVWPTDLVALGGQPSLFHAKGSSKDMLPWLLQHGADPALTGWFLRDGEEQEWTALQYFEEIDRIECNLLEETLTLRAALGTEGL